MKTYALHFVESREQLHQEYVQQMLEYGWVVDPDVDDGEDALEALALPEFNPKQRDWLTAFSERWETMRRTTVEPLTEDDIQFIRSLLQAEEAADPQSRHMPEPMPEQLVQRFIAHIP